MSPLDSAFKNVDTITRTNDSNNELGLDTVGNKYLYILIAVVLLALLILGILYLVSGSKGKAPDSPTLTRVDAPVDFPLEIIAPAILDLVVKESPINIRGRTRLDALVTVNDYVVEPDIEGYFQQAIDLAPGLNIIEVIASIASGEQESLVLAVGYFPE